MARENPLPSWPAEIVSGGNTSPGLRSSNQSREVCDAPVITPLMRIAGSCGFAIAALALTAGLAQGSPKESLGEIARRDRERQKRTSRPARVYTVEDLRERGRKPQQATAAVAAVEDAASTSELDRERDERRALEDKWRERFGQARQRIKEAESRAWRTVIRPVLVGGTASGMIQG